MEKSVRVRVPQGGPNFMKKKVTKLKIRFRGLGELCICMDKLSVLSRYYLTPLTLYEGILSDKDCFPIDLSIEQWMINLYNGKVVYVKKIPYLLTIQKRRDETCNLQLTPI